LACNAALTSVCFGKPWPFGGSLPASEHAFTTEPSASGLVSWSSWVVPFSAPTVLPHRSSVALMPFGLHLATMVDVPASK
jgi:hypothetical protein